MIRFERVRKDYGNAAKPVVAVDDVSLTVAAEEIVCLIGTSGSGKTTLLKMANRLIEPSAGRVLVGGEPVAELDVIRLRRGIGYVIQRGGLFPHMSVARNIGLLCELEGWQPAAVRERVETLLAMVNLPPADYAARLPRELSGGQQQRVGVARALALDPPIVLMDEPFGAVDPITRDQLRSEFLQLARAVKKTILLVTHDLGEAFLLGDRVALMDGGRLLQVGSEQDMRQRPATPFVAEFVGSHASPPAAGERS